MISLLAILFYCRRKCHTALRNPTALETKAELDGTQRTIGLEELERRERAIELEGLPLSELEVDEGVGEIHDEYSKRRAAEIEWCVNKSL